MTDKEFESFLLRSKDLCVVLVRAMEAELKDQDPNMFLKIGLFTLAKTSAMILQQVRDEEREETVTVFCGTILASIDQLEHAVTSEHLAKQIIKKAMNK
jgi:hypothetical protein